MKSNYLSRFCFVLMLYLVALACKKSVTPVSTPANLLTGSQWQASLRYLCVNAPNYGDSIIYLQPAKGDYIINPVNRAALGEGKFFSWPAGLVMDSLTGALNLSQSETGMRYVIGFVKAGTTDTCSGNLIVGGITYADSIHVLTNNDTLAIPYYNANAANPAVCNASTDSDYPDGNGNGDGQCIFDGKDKNGNIGQANSKKVRVRTISGVINLKKTVADGAFGSNPADGSGILVPIAYSLADNSKKALQQINVQLLYYRYRSSVPPALLNTISQNNQAFFQNIPVAATPRPPIIIVSAFN